MKDKNDSQVFNLYTKDGKMIDIPINGCLGLLALGDVGLMAWRQKKIVHLKELENQKTSK